ncbi:di-heme oxidoredictase family protein [Halobacteriovorax sp. JY17]|uniref:di-heme oxidoreductase family protein n=1 Tax=Halobacteriovorax sp. JY17 TaxID=2014617 RepID=UPI000C49CB9E|nr:di-heme oxidoredictase family protein [Halobacteriovorax sp. JY17]PIK15256.1 MAG: thiol oxidoreductase [Halobacteriovorax sp. JY17]
MNKSLRLKNILPLLIIILISSGAKARTLSFTGPKDFARLIEGLSSSELAKVKAGFSLFAKPWVAAPSSTRVRDGLGPHFNATSCMSCHSRMGRGNPLRSDGSLDHSILFRVSTGNTSERGPVPDAIYGLQLQGKSLIQIEREAEVSVHYTSISGTYPDGTTYSLRKPSFNFSKLNYGPFDSLIHISPRTSPILAGLGFIDAISKEDILSQVDEFDLDRDGISGRANYSWSASKNKLMVGRFGHKANVPTLLDQIAGALQGDMGITSSLAPLENCGELQLECHSILNGGEPEISDDHIGFIHLLLKSIAPPKVEVVKSEDFGRKIFSKIGCVKCHTANYAVRGREVSPYSDFLLHDMGEELADNREDFKATGREWKTAPLWGLGSLKKVNGHTNLLHDGRARNVEEAILWHGGEASKTREKFKALSKKERSSLLKFLNQI